MQEKTMHSSIFSYTSHVFQKPGVPIIYALRNALLLEPPSATQRAFVKTSEEERSHMNEKEYEMLKKRIKSTLTNEEQNGTFNEGLVEQNLPVQAMTKTPTARKGTNMKDKVQFKRKKAKVINHSNVFHISIYGIIYLFLSFL